MINVETNAGADFPEVRESAQAAIDYVNAYRGGLDGHPIKLVTCITDGQPATSASCATKLVADHPVADLGGADIAQSASLPILAKAGPGPDRRSRSHPGRVLGEELDHLR